MLRLALALLVTLAASCSRGSPVSVVRALGEAARDGDRAEVMALLGPETRARLTEDARLASEQAGRRRLGPEDLLAVGWAPASDEIEDVREVGRDGDRASVEVIGRRGAQQRFEVVRVHGAWKVELR